MVTLRSGSDEYAGSTDVEGRYVLRLPIGVYSATVAAQGFTPVTDSGIHAPSGGASYSAVLEHAVMGVPNPGLPSAIELRSIHPNPLQKFAVVSYSLAQAGNVELGLHDVMGRQVARLEAGWKPAGTHSVDLSAEGLPAGIYFFMLRAGDRIAWGRMTLVP